MLGGGQTSNLGREGPPSHPRANPSKGSLVGCLEWPFGLQNARWEISRCGARNENGYNCSRHPSKQKIPLQFFGGSILASENTRPKQRASVCSFTSFLFSFSKTIYCYKEEDKYRHLEQNKDMYKWRTLAVGSWKEGKV